VGPRAVLDAVVKLGFREMSCADVNLIGLAQDKSQWQLVKIRDPINDRNVLDN